MNHETNLTVSHGSSDFDPVTFSVILSRFNSIVNEMSITLARSASSSILALANDYSCAIYDRDANQVCMFDSAPVHTMSLHLVLREIAKDFDDDIAEGDVFLANDPYRGNTHIGDLVAATPVFVGGRLRFWSVAKGHQLDVGSPHPASMAFMTKSVYEEGLHIPPLKVIDRGRERRDVLGLYFANLRYPELSRLDLFAEIGAIRKGAERLVELCAEFGADEAEHYTQAILDYSDARTAEHIRSWPDGCYKAEIWIDSDGATEEDLPVLVSVTIEGDAIKVDYSGSAPQVGTGMNGTYAVAQASGALAFMYYIDPDIPHNEGCFRHVSVDAPVGTICLGKFPASTTVATCIPSDAMHDVVNKAMAQAVPDLVPAGGARGAGMVQVSGIDERTGKDWGAFLFNNNGGAGATKRADGWPVIGTIAGLGCLRCISIEQLELLYPILAEHMEIEPDSMGFGTHIGGPGVRFVMRPTHGRMVAASYGDGWRNPPHGVCGGSPSAGGGQFVEDATTGERTFISACGFFAVSMEQRRVGVGAGGGGYGSPLQRDARQVACDLRDGLITRRVAHNVFGVVSDERTAEVDAAATQERRKELSGGELGLIDPTKPDAATWLGDERRAKDPYLLNPVDY